MMPLFVLFIRKLIKRVIKYVRFDLLKFFIIADDMFVIIALPDGELNMLTTSHPGDRSLKSSNYCGYRAIDRFLKPFNGQLLIFGRGTIYRAPTCDIIQEIFYQHGET